MDRKEILESISKERERQDELYGEIRKFSAPSWYTILGEEYGEVGRGIMRNELNLKEELIQTAAVIVAWLETIDRKDLKTLDLCEYWEAKRQGLNPELPKVPRDIIMRNEE